MADALKSYVKRAYRRVVGARRYERLEFRRHLGYWPNLDDPQSFNEKVCARKFHPIPEAIVLTDKLAVREFVTRKAGPEFLTQLYDSGASPEAVNYEALPNRFVLKGNHSSGPAACLLVRDKKRFPRHAFIAAGRRILRQRFGPEVNELWYAQIPPRILVEEMLLDEDGSIPPDFKFYVFGGTVRYVQVTTGRSKSPRSRFYDPSWCPQPFSRGVAGGVADVSRPHSLADMISLAETLGNGFDFIRVDLYSTGHRVVFGEMTFAPGAGWISFDPPAYDLILGQQWPSAGAT